MKKQYYDSHKEKIQKYQQQYIELNKEKIKEKTKLYREQNRDRLNAHRRERVLCDCGIEYSRGSKNRHIQIQKHVEFLAKTAYLVVS